MGNSPSRLMRHFEIILVMSQHAISNTFDNLKKRNWLGHHLKRWLYS